MYIIYTFYNVKCVRGNSCETKDIDCHEIKHYLSGY